MELVALFLVFGLSGTPGRIVDVSSGERTDFMQWRETTLGDFADGELDPALYVSRRAELESDSGCVGVPPPTTTAITTGTTT